MLDPYSIAMGVTAAVIAVVGVYLILRKPRPRKPLHLPGFEGHTQEVQRHVGGEDTGVIAYRHSQQALSLGHNRPDLRQLAPDDELRTPVRHRRDS